MRFHPSGYAAGAATMGGNAYGRRPEIGNAGVDVKMPANIRDEIITVATQVHALDKVIGAARSSLPGDFVGGWDLFRAEWDRFAQSHTGWTSRLWYATYEKTVEYRKRLEDWRTRFEQLTGTKVAFPSPGATPEGMDKDGSGFPWKALLWGGLAIGGLYGIAKVMNETRQLKREIVGSRTLGGHHHHDGEEES